MPNFVLKTIIGNTIAVGGVGSVFLSKKLFIASNIKEKLESEGYKVLSTIATAKSMSDGDHDYQEWKEIVSKWDTDYELPKFVNNSLENNLEVDRISSLKTKCQSILSESIEDLKYESAKKYCSVLKK